MASSTLGYINRRGGGLEEYGTDVEKLLLINRRGGGLEVFGQSARHVDNINRRGGGLEAEAAARAWGNN